MIAALIVGCEIAFWVFVGLGLTFRYVLKQPKVGALLLIGTPIIDLILLIAAAADLRSGAVAGWEHGIAAIYIGASIVYGHRLIRWADVRFAHWFASGPPPQRKPKYGQDHAKRERHGWYLHLASWAIGSVLLIALLLWVNDDRRTETLRDIVRYWTLILGIDFLISFSYTLWPRNQKNVSNETKNR
ncbi:putative membrane protein YmcC [Paenibacillus sp. CCS19]|nr:putative membrane protein YmcC [Paenibacillus cellulosilyticus]